MNINRFHDLGSGLEMDLRYQVGRGWSGWAKVYVRNEREARAEFDPEQEGHPGIRDFDAFADRLHERLLKKVSKIQVDNTTSEQLEEEWKAIEKEAADKPGQPFQSVRAIYVLKERIKRLEALLLEEDEQEL